MLNRTEQIDDLFRLCQTDKGSSFHNYASIYESIPEKIESMMEVGVYKGASLNAWLEIFPYAHIWAIDKESRFSPIITKNHRIHFKQANIEDFDATSLPMFDLIVDDGSHRLDHMKLAWEKLLPHLKPGGTFIIEDVPHANWVEHFPGSVVIEVAGKSTYGDNRVILYRA